MTAERPTTERLREALLALADEMDEADVMSGPGTGEYADRIREALAAAPVDRDGLLTPLQREVAEAPACVRCERAITTLGDLYRCASCNGAFHLTCIHEHFGWTVNGAPDAERHAAPVDRELTFTVVEGHNHTTDGLPTYPVFRDACPQGCDAVRAGEIAANTGRRPNLSVHDPFAEVAAAQAVVRAALSAPEPKDRPTRDPDMDYERRDAMLEVVMRQYAHPEDSR